LIHVLLIPVAVIPEALIPETRILVAVTPVLLILVALIHVPLIPVRLIPVGVIPVPLTLVAVILAVMMAVVRIAVKLIPETRIRATVTCAAKIHGRPILVLPIPENLFAEMSVLGTSIPEKVGHHPSILEPYIPVSGRQRWWSPSSLIQKTWFEVSEMGILWPKGPLVAIPVTPTHLTPRMVNAEMVIPEMAVLEMAVLEMAVPEMAVLEMAVPEMAVPEMAVPEMAVPGMAVPEMLIPETLVGPTVFHEMQRAEMLILERAIPLFLAQRLLILQGPSSRQRARQEQVHGQAHFRRSAPVSAPAEFPHNPDQ
jgi:hypothetical protein